MPFMQYIHSSPLMHNTIIIFYNTIIIFTPTGAYFCFVSFIEREGKGMRESQIENLPFIFKLSGIPSCGIKKNLS